MKSSPKWKTLLCEDESERVFVKGLGFLTLASTARCAFGEGLAVIVLGFSGDFDRNVSIGSLALLYGVGVKFNFENKSRVCDKFVFM
jgi:hypothetical protein